MRCFLFWMTMLLAWGGGITSPVLFSQTSDTNAITAEAPTSPVPLRIAPRRSPAFRSNNDLVKIGSDVTVHRGESTRDVVVVGGNANVNGQVKGDVVVVMGTADVRGTVDGDLVVVMGTAKLGPEARVKGAVTVVGSDQDINANAIVGGDLVEIGFGKHLPGISWMGEWFRDGLLRARPFPPLATWAWVCAGIFLLFHIFVALIFSGAIESSTRSIEERPVGSFFVGLLVLFLAGPLLCLLAISVIGIIVIPFILCGVALALIFGKVAVYRYAGQQMGRPFGVSFLQQPLVAIVTGTMLCYVLYMTPFIGFFVLGVIAILGMGAVFLAATGRMRRESARATATMNANLAAARMNASAPSANATIPPLPAFGAAGPGAVPPLVVDYSLLQRVGFWRRFWATLLDLVIVMTAYAFFRHFGLLLWLAYHIVFWGWRGTTLGGIVLGIKIVRENGKPITWGVATVRALAGIFSGIAMGIGFFWAGWTQERQAWHDKIAGTIVVRIPNGLALI